MIVLAALKRPWSGARGRAQYYEVWPQSRKKSVHRHCQNFTRGRSVGRLKTSCLMSSEDEGEEGRKDERKDGKKKKGPKARKEQKERKK